MQRDIEALELMCKNYDAFYSSDALRKEKNRVRALQRRVTKLEAENAVLKGGIKRWREACQQHRRSEPQANEPACRRGHALKPTLQKEKDGPCIVC